MKFEYVHITKPQGPPQVNFTSYDLSPWEIENRDVFPKGDSRQISPRQTVFPKVNIWALTMLAQWVQTTKETRFALKSLSMKPKVTLARHAMPDGMNRPKQRPSGEIS